MNAWVDVTCYVINVRWRNEWIKCVSENCVDFVNIRFCGLLEADDENVEPRVLFVTLLRVMKLFWICMNKVSSILIVRF